jgi:hypothetical protein
LWWCRHRVHSTLGLCALNGVKIFHHYHCSSRCADSVARFLLQVMALLFVCYEVYTITIITVCGCVSQLFWNLRRPLKGRDLSTLNFKTRPLVAPLLHQLNACLADCLPMFEFTVRSSTYRTVQCEHWSVECACERNTISSSFLLFSEIIEIILCALVWFDLTTWPNLNSIFFTASVGEIWSWVVLCCSLSYSLLSQCMPRHSFQQTQEEYDDVNFQVTLLNNEISIKDGNSAMSKLVH